jgi:GntR family transcriptional regulator
VGTFITQAPDIADLRQMAGLQKKLAGWLGEAAAAGVDEIGMKALFTAALRNFNDAGGAAPLPGRGGREGGEGGEGGVDRGARRDGGAA